MRITEWPASERPREKLVARGPRSLSDAELLAVFLHTGIPGKTAVDIARNLLTRFGSLRALLNAPCADICREKGLGEAKYVALQAALEMGRRYLGEKLERGATIESADDTRRYLQAQLRDRQQEVFCCLFLDNRHRLITFEELFHGTLNGAAVYPREIIKRAMHHNAAALILVHNHPSGVAEPSRQDEILTEKLKESLETMDIRLLDHFVVGDGDVVSFSELGKL